MDSPLVTFREADHEEDELRSEQKVVIKHVFFSDLASSPAQSQGIVLENEDPDEAAVAATAIHNVPRGIMVN